MRHAAFARCRRIDGDIASGTLTPCRTESRPARVVMSASIYRRYRDITTALALQAMPASEAMTRATMLSATPLANSFSRQHFDFAMARVAGRHGRPLGASSGGHDTERHCFSAHRHAAWPSIPDAPAHTFIAMPLCAGAMISGFTDRVR